MDLKKPFLWVFAEMPRLAASANSYATKTFTEAKEDTDRDDHETFGTKTFTKARENDDTDAIAESSPTWESDVL